MKKHKVFGSTIGSWETTMWVRDQIRTKRFKLSDIEKLIIIALADSPATLERLIAEYDLNQERTEKALERLLQKKLIYYHELGDYVYAVWVPED